jgi:4-amino-4-deoxy-L-arabinose transferase-like glycosyltransferase
MAKPHHPESISPARQAMRLLLLAVFLVVLTWLTAIPNSPALRNQNRDSGMYAYVGMAISRGGDAYVDAWNHKSPGIYYAYGLAFRLLGESRWAIWLAEAAAELLTLAVFYRFVTAWLKKPALGLLGTACLALISRNPILTAAPSPRALPCCPRRSA